MVCRYYAAATRMTIADLSHKAKVSQPTVTRFCRSLGCTSFADFKIKLATTLTVAAAYLKSDRVFDDDVGQLAQTIMMRAATAVRECLDQLDTQVIGEAIDALSECRRVDLYGEGVGSAGTVDDAELRLVNFGFAVFADLNPAIEAFAVSTLCHSPMVVVL